MSDTLIIGIMTTAAAMVTVGLNIFWMSKAFEQLSSAIKETRDSIKETRDSVKEVRDSVKDLASRMDRRFEAIENDLKHAKASAIATPI